MTLALTFHADARAFAAAVTPYLEPREERYGLIYGLARRLVESGEHSQDDIFATAEADGVVAGAVLRTPGRKVLLTDLADEWISVAAREVAARLEEVPGVRGEASRAWQPGENGLSTRGAEIPRPRRSVGSRAGADSAVEATPTAGDQLRSKVIVRDRPA